MVYAAPDAGSILQNIERDRKGADIKLPLQVKIQLRQGGSVVSEKLVMLTNEF